MGIRDLWEVLSPASHNRTLAQLAVSEGFEMQRRPDHCLNIGIDASVWMNQAQLATKPKRGSKGTRSGENPAVRNLFYRLCRLLTLPIVPIFVFDGPNRPSRKRGTTVKTARAHWLTLPFQKFIESFGFSWYMAPGEAEADLAELNRAERIDAIISEDNDAMVFGARCVIRMRNIKDVGDRVSIFDAKFIQTHPDVALDHGALFFMAILCGGDYDKMGLKGCGQKTAHRLAQTELAHSLFAAATSSSRGALSAFVDEWRVAFCVLLEEDPDQVLGRRYPSLAKIVTDTKFPSVDILLQYGQPITSSTRDQAPDQSAWHLRQPHLAQIGILCEKYFSWGSSGDIIPRLRNTLWPGVAIRYLLTQRGVDGFYERYADDIAEDTNSITTLHPLRIFQGRLGPGVSSTHPEVRGYTIQTLTNNILRDVIAGLDAAMQSLVMNSDDLARKISFWVPAAILQAAVPDLINRFKGNPPPTVPSYSPIISAFMLDELPPEEFCRCSWCLAEFHGNDTYTSSAVSPAQDSESDAIEFMEGSSTMPKFLGFVDLCTPSPCPSP